MTVALLTALLTVLFSFQSLFCKLYSSDSPAEARAVPYVFNLFYAALVSLLTFAVNGFSCRPSPLTLLLAAGCAAAGLAYNIFIVKASLAGPYPTMMIFMLFGGILVPMISDLVAFRTELSPLQYAGVALMLAALVLMTRSGRSETRPTPRFMFYCVMLFVTNGVFGTIFNIQQHLNNGGERGDFLTALFGLSSLATLVILLFMYRGKPWRHMKQTKRSAIYLLVSAVSSCGAQNLVLYCLTLLSPAVLYSIDNGGVLILSVVYSLFLFRERITPVKWCGIALATASIVMLSL